MKIAAWQVGRDDRSRCSQLLRHPQCPRAEAHGPPSGAHQRAGADDAGAQRRGAGRHDGDPQGALGGRRGAGRAAAGGIRGSARSVSAQPRRAPLRRAARRRHRAARRQDRGDAHRRGQDAGGDLAGLSECPCRRRPRRHGERLPGAPRRGLDGADLQRARHDGRRGAVQSGRREQARRLPGGRRLRHQQRVRLRLPTRQHGVHQGGPRPALVGLCRRRRSGFDPHRRSAHAAHHFRPGGPEHRSLREDRQAGAQARAPGQDRERPAGGAGRQRAAAGGDRRLLRGRKEPPSGTHRARPRTGGKRAQAPRRARSERQPLRRRQPRPAASRPRGAARPFPVPARRPLHGSERRDRDRRRTHRARHAGAPLGRWTAPGGGSEGARADPQRDADAGLHDAAELLPPLRQALRHDRHGGYGSDGVQADLRPRRDHRAHPQADDPRRPQRPRLHDRGRKVRRGGGRNPRGHGRWPAGAGGHRVHRVLGTPLRRVAAAQGRAQRAERQAARTRGGDRRPGRPGRRRHHRHQHGRPRHRHRARRQRGGGNRGPRRKPGPQPTSTPPGAPGRNATTP